MFQLFFRNQITIIRSNKTRISNIECGSVTMSRVSTRIPIPFPQTLNILIYTENTGNQDLIASSSPAFQRIDKTPADSF